MFFWLPVLTLSIFIPYFKSESSNFKTVNDEQLHAIIRDCNSVLALVVGPFENEISSKLNNIFINSVSFYANFAKFIVLVSSNVPTLVSSFDYQKPFLVYFKNGQIYYSCECPLDENAFAFLINSWLIGYRDNVNCLDDLKKDLTNNQFTLVSRKNDVQSASLLLYNVMPYIGSCELVIGSDSFFKEVNMSNDKFALYRSQDLTLVPVQNSFESIINGSIPTYKVFNKNDFNEENLEYLVLITDQFKNEYHDIFYKLTKEYPEYKIGAVTSEGYPAIQVIISKSISYIPDLFLINPSEGYYYPNNNLFQNKSLKSKSFASKIKCYINDIRAKKINPIYFSEELPQENNNTYVHKVVGLNYQEFIQDDNNDVVILYSPSFGPKEVFDMFNEVALSLKGEKIKFGIYDNIRNASPMKLPEFVQIPHIEIFPKGDKNNSKPMLSLMNKNGLYRFLKEYSKVNISVQNITQREAFKELETLRAVYEKLSEKTQKLITKYIETNLSNISNTNFRNEFIQAMG